MTRKKHVDIDTELSIRQRALDHDTERNMFVSGYPPSTSDAGQSVDQTLENTTMEDMYRFCHEMNKHDLPFNNDFFESDSTPVLLFPAPEDMEEDEVPQPNLFFTYVAAELNDSGVRFDGLVHPFLNDNVADENNEPYLTSPEAESETVPVYPQWQPRPFNAPPPPIPSNWGSNAFSNAFQKQEPAESSDRPRIVPIPPSRPRTIFPKGKPAPRLAPSDAFDIGEINTGRGRKRALSPESRAAAREVRIMHACGRCRKKREKCGTTRPCKPCMSKRRRNLDIPCMQELPESRGGHLFTPVIYGHLELEQVKDTMPKAHRGSQAFEIRLHQWFDDPELRLPVASFIPKDVNEVKKSIFPIGRNNAGFILQQTEILSPPLVPFFSTEESYLQFKKKFYWSVRRWLEQAEIYEDIGWHQIYFREEYGKAWPRAILGDICTFYHHVTSTGCPVLKSALATTVLVYMIGHSFYVPEEDVEDVLRKTFGSNFRGEPTEWVSPLYVDRFVKVLLLPVFKGGVNATLRGLQNLYSPAKPSEFVRDRILASSIVLLMIAGSQQSKAIERALARFKLGQEVDRDEVSSQIQEIEHYIVDLVLQLWKYKFPADAVMGKDEARDRHDANRAKSFGLLERFRDSYTESSEFENLERIPIHLSGDIDSKKFGVNNIERILKKFYMAVFPSE